MELGIKSGVKIPAVCVVKKKSHIYEIQYGADPDRNLLDSWSGGHHRSRARFNLDSPLKCIAVGGHWENPRGNINVPIEDIMIVEGFYSSECMRHSLSCLPTEVAEKFCREHGLNTDTYLSQ